jgi:curli biogenesis system outer membrane secretion channel CsgG
MRIGLVLLLVYGLCGAARADPVHIDAEGSGTTRDMAVAKALASAIGQATGVTIDAAQFSGMATASVATDAAAGSVMVQATQEAIRQTAGGTIRSYRIISVAPAPEGGFLADVAVEVEVYRAKGLGNETRRRIAVAAFADGNAHGAGQALRDSLLRYLIQSRRFAVVDRANDAAYAAEMAVATSEEAAPAERARAGQVIAADYVVTGKVAVVAPRTTTEVLELTGERIQHTSAGSAAAEFEVIEIATRQIKWAGQVSLPGNGADVDAVAARIGEDITQSIFPIRLIKFDDPQRLVLNEGGIGLRPGQRFRAMLLGEALQDPYTHESLGQSEQEIGIVEITEVQPKVSYARLVSGRLPDAHQELLLRPAPPPVAPARATKVVAKAPTEAGGGTKLPFDR